MNKFRKYETVFIVVLLWLTGCSSVPEYTLHPLAVSNTIDAEGNVYFGTRYATSGGTFANTLNVDYLHDDGQVYRVQVENVRANANDTSELGRIEKSSLAARRGGSSLRFETQSTASNNYSKRAELLYLTNDNAAENFPVIPFNTEKYTGFSIRFPSTFQDPTAWFVFHQIWQDIAPPVAFEFASSTNPSTTDPLKLRIKVRNDDRNSLLSNEWHWPINRTWADGTSSDIILERNRWYDFVLRWKADPSTSASGIVQVWLDGVLIVNYAGKVGYTSATAGVTTNGNYEKLGIYRGQQTLTHSLFQDELRSATAFYEVIPAWQLKEEFSGSLTNWTGTGASASWSILNGRLLQTNATAGTNTNLVTNFYNLTSAQTWSNYRVYGEFERRNNDDDPMGLVFYRNASNNYYVFFQSNDPGTGNAGCYLEKWNGSAKVSVTQKVTTGDCTGTNGVFNMTVTARAEGTGTRIIGLLNGKQVFNYLDTTSSRLTQGTVGVYSQQNEGFADNIVVSFLQ